MNVKNQHAVALGKLGGSSKTEVKRAASKRNGQLGGRPKKAHSSMAARMGKNT